MILYGILLRVLSLMHQGRFVISNRATRVRIVNKAKRIYLLFDFHDFFKTISTFTLNSVYSDYSRSRTQWCKSGYWGTLLIFYRFAKLTIGTDPKILYFWTHPILHIFLSERDLYNRSGGYLANGRFQNGSTRDEKKLLDATFLLLMTRCL